jgi:methylated-DNA-protein-cysteine methyltransferase related protein
MSPFKEKVIEVIRLVPYGNVVSYGQVAAYAGVPRAARQVGWILRGIESSVALPWWRVINNSGRISIDGNLYNDKHVQKRLLESEGIGISNEFTVNIERYRFIADDALLKKLQLDDAYIQELHKKYFLT